MNLGEIMELGGWIVGGLATLYAGGLTVGCYLQTFGEKIESQEQLRQMVTEEASKIGISSGNIIANYDSKNNTGKSSEVDIVREDNGKLRILSPDEPRNSEGVKTVRFLELGGSGATRRLLRHELCHLKYDFNKPKSLVRYLLWEEPMATIYGLTGFDVRARGTK